MLLNNNRARPFNRSRAEKVEEKNPEWDLNAKLSHLNESVVAEIRTVLYFSNVVASLPHYLSPDDLPFKHSYVSINDERLI